MTSLILYSSSEMIFGVPIVTCYFNGYIVKCLVDTGAVSPVCCEFNILKGVFRNINKVGKQRLSGFGGQGKLEDVYSCGDLYLSDIEGNCIKYNNFHFVNSTSRDTWPWSFIISATMLQFSEYHVYPLKQAVRIDTNNPVVGVRFDRHTGNISTFAQLVNRV